MMQFPTPSIVFERNVPIPNARRIGVSAWLYPALEKLKDGESLFVSAPEDVVERQIRPSLTVYGKKAGKKFTSRRMDGGIRVWLLSQ